MSEFSKVVITNKGQALIAKLMSGSGIIEFTEIKVSETAYPESQLESLTAITGVKQTTAVSKVTRTDDVTVQVEGIVGNESLSVGYYMRTIGLFAEDPQGGDILFAVTTAQQAGFMPPFNGKTVSGAHFKIVTTVGNSSNVTLQVDPEAVALIGDLRDLEAQINNFTTQLAQKVDKGNVSVSDINKNLGKLDATFFDEDFVTQLNNGTINYTNLLDGSVTQDKVSNGAINAKKTTFAQTKNLFSGEFTTAYLAGENPSFTYEIGTTTTSAEFLGEAGSTYTVSKSLDTDRFIISVFSKKPQAGDSPVRIVNRNPSAETVTFTLSGTERYLVIYVSSSGNIKPSELQIEKGSQKTTYAKPGSVSIDFEDKSIKGKAIDFDSFRISVDNTNFASAGRNKFTGEYSDGFYLAGPVGGGVYSLAKSADTGYSMVIQQIKPSTDYTVYKQGGDRFRLATFEDIPIEGSVSKRVVVAKDTLSTVSFKSSASERYIGFYVKTPTGSAVDKLQIEESAAFTEYVKPNAVKIDLDPSSFDGAGIVGGGKSYYIEGDLSGNFTSSSAFINTSEAITSASVYDFYNNLVSLYPDYITREQIGTGSGSLPIYAYHFTPPKTQRLRADENIPRIAYITGLHGSEAYNICDGMRFFKELCDGWKTNKIMETLRWNVSFSVVPAANPWGVTNKSRKNANGVDLNRNFPKDWQFIQSDTTHSQYQGPSPLSEPESQALSEFLEAGAFSFAIDHHNYNSLASDGHAIWIGTENDEVLKMIFGLNRYLNAKIKKDYSFISPSNESLILTVDLRGPTTPNKGMVSQYFEEIGVPGVIHESVFSIGGTAQDTQQFTTDALGNLILSAVRNLDRFI